MGTGILQAYCALTHESSTRILLHDEQAGRLQGLWEDVSPSTVRTVREVYEDLKAMGYPIIYRRVPITDEKAPEGKDMEAIMHSMQIKPSSDSATGISHIVFNCQMGRGRTTTGMVLACLWCYIVGQAELSTTVQDNLALSDIINTSELRYRRGEFKVILRLVRVLKGGGKLKNLLDMIIDQCAIFQNLREAITEHQRLSEAAQLAANTEVAKFNFNRAHSYLERYFYLLAFAGYLSEFKGQQHLASQKNPGKDTEAVTFDAYLQHHPEILALANEITLE